VTTSGPERTAPETPATEGPWAIARGLWVYALHVIALIRPGRLAPTHLPPVEAKADLSRWADEELTLMIEEGRRQLDRQFDSLEKVRGRAQWLFSIALVLAGAAASLATSIFPRPSCWALLFWIMCLVATSWSALGFAATITVNARFGAIAANKLSRYAPPIKLALATAYAEMLDIGEQTLNTRLTVLRQAVVWLIVGAALALATLLYLKV
jgi:hypothetical protein